MKRFAKFVSLLTAAAALALLPGANTLQVSADSPTTFYLRFNAGSNDWRMQRGTWDENSEGRELYYLNNGDEKIKDGDIVVVQPPNGQASNTDLTIDVHLSNLTINRTSAVVKTKGIDECYVLGDSYAAINGDVTNAYVYDNAICTFNNNVNTLTVNAEDNIQASISVGGTVAHLIELSYGNVRIDRYNFAAGKLYYNVNGVLETTAEYYSTTPTSDTPAASAPAAPQPAASPSPAPSSDEYDDVPKTGESNLILWLAGISALCFAGSFALRKVR